MSIPIQFSNMITAFSADDKIQIKLDKIKSRKHIPIHKKNGNIVYAPLYTLSDTAISGKLQINLKGNLVQQYLSAKIELIGKIEFFGVGKKGGMFLLVVKDLGKITDPQETFNFKFDNFPKNYETYTGQLIEIKYVLQATIVNWDLTEIKQEQEIALHLSSPSPANTNIFTIQIGVLEAVEVDLEYKKTDYHLEDCIIGKVLVNLAQVKIKKMELYLIKVENFYFGSKSKIKEEVLKKITLKEGQPKKGEIIPIKLALSSLDLSPTMINVENRFFVKYFLTLGLIDLNERMFFRKVEITLRRAP